MPVFHAIERRYSIESTFDIVDTLFDHVSGNHDNAVPPMSIEYTITISSHDGILVIINDDRP